MAVAREELEILPEVPEIEPSPIAVGRGRRRTNTELDAWYRELGEWVADFRVDYAFLWSAFPTCWYRHRGLVELFALLRAAQSQLAKHGAAAVAQRDALDWVVFLQTVSTAVYRVDRMCHGGHKDHRRLYGQADRVADYEFDRWLSTHIEKRDDAQ